MNGVGFGRELGGDGHVAIQAELVSVNQLRNEAFSVWVPRRFAKAVGKKSEGVVEKGRKGHGQRPNRTGIGFGFGFLREKRHWMQVVGEQLVDSGVIVTLKLRENGRSFRIHGGWRG